MDGKDTFRIEVLAFPGLTPDEAAAALAGPLGIAADKAAEHVKRLPAVVKVGVAAGGAQTLARNLLAAGADVRLTHDASGEVRTYEARVAAMDRASIVQSRGQRPLPSLPPAAPAAAASTGSPPAPAPVIGPAPDAPAETAPGLPAARQRCGSCGMPVPPDKVTCPRCGWNAARHQRRCPACDGTLQPRTPPLPGGPAARGALYAVLVIVPGAASMAIAILLGVRASLAAISAAMAVGLATLAALLGYRCEACHGLVSGSFLDPAEKTALAIRRLSAAIGAVLLVGVAALLGYPFLLTPAFDVTTPSGTYSAVLPGTHHFVDRDEIPMNTPMGRLEAMTAMSENGRADVALFGMLAIPVPPTVDLGNEERRGKLLQDSLDGAATNIGCKLTETLPAALGDVSGLEGVFRGEFEGRPVNGRARALVLGGDVVIVMFAGHDPSTPDAPAGLAFLDSLLLTPAAPE